MVSETDRSLTGSLDRAGPSGRPPAGRDGRRTALGSYATDARLLQYATTADRLAWLAVADATYATAVDDLLGVTAETRLTDLAIAIENDQLSLHSASPAAIRLDGQVTTRARRVLLNGREWPAVPAGSGELLIPASAWAEETRRVRL